MKKILHGIGVYSDICVMLFYFVWIIIGIMIIFSRAVSADPYLAIGVFFFISCQLTSGLSFKGWDANGFPIWSAESED